MSKKIRKQDNKIRCQTGENEEKQTRNHGKQRKEETTEIQQKLNNQEKQTKQKNI
jgi:hypothetical protein